MDPFDHVRDADNPDLLKLSVILMGCGLVYYGFLRWRSKRRRKPDSD